MPAHPPEPPDPSPLAVLDDPVPFRPSSDLLAGARTRGRRLRRRRRLLVTGTDVPLLVLLGLVAGALYVDHRSDEVHRVTVADGTLAPVTPGQPFNLLVVGTDGPRGQAGVSADTIMLVHVDEAAGHVNLLSVPRDLVWDASEPRLGSVLATQGPQALVDQLDQHLGISISHYVEIDQPGLADLVNQIGGVRVDSPTALRDAGSGLALQAGCSTLDGDQVVALVRARHLESQDRSTGGWTFDPTSDLGREVRQQELVAILGAKLVSMPLDGSTLSTLLDVFADHTTIDAGFSRSALLALVEWGHGLTPRDLTTSTVPTHPFVTAQGADVLVLQNQAGEVVRPLMGATGTGTATTPGTGTVQLHPVGSTTDLSGC